MKRAAMIMIFSTLVLNGMEQSTTQSEPMIHGIPTKCIYNQVQFNQFFCKLDPKRKRYITELFIQESEEEKEIIARSALYLDWPQSNKELFCDIPNEETFPFYATLRSLIKSSKLHEVRITFPAKK